VNRDTNILDSERSDECIIFCLSSLFEAVKMAKMLRFSSTALFLNLVGTLRVNNKNFPIVFRSIRKNKQKTKEK